MNIFRQPFPLFVVLAMALSPGPGFGQEAKPAFDCAKARLKVEKEICASPELARLDAEIATLYAHASEALDASGKAALAVSQKEYLSERNSDDQGWDFDLKEHMQRRHDFLKSIRASRGEWAGSWGADNGNIVLTPRSDGLYDVTARTNDATAACDFERGGKINGAVMTTVPRNKQERADDPYNGWKLLMTRAGDTLTVKTRRGPKGGANPFCGEHGSLDGAWLPVQNQSGK